MGFRLAILSIQTPRKIVMKPQIKDMVLITSVVLKPWNNRKDAINTAVVKVT